MRIRHKIKSLLLLLGIVSCLGGTNNVQATEISEGVQTEGVITFYEGTATSESSVEESISPKQPIKTDKELSLLPQTSEKKSGSQALIGGALLLAVGLLIFWKSNRSEVKG